MQFKVIVKTPMQMYFEPMQLAGKIIAISGILLGLMLITGLNVIEYHLLLSLV